jgi:hypothetical protein
MALCARSAARGFLASLGPLFVAVRGSSALSGSLSHRADGSNPTLSAKGLWACPNSQVLADFVGCAPAVFPKAVLARREKLRRRALRAAGKDPASHAILRGVQTPHHDVRSASMVPCRCSIPSIRT